MTKPDWAGYQPRYRFQVSRPKTPVGRKPPEFVIRLHRDRPNDRAWHVWRRSPTEDFPGWPAWRFYTSHTSHAEAIASIDRLLNTPPEVPA